MGLSTRLAALGARFDRQALQAYEPGLPVAAAPAKDWPALRHWCLAQPARRFAMAVPGLRAPALEPVDPDSSARAMALALQLDGTHALLACRSGAERLALRARVKWQDWVGDDVKATVLPASRVWDSGRARGDAAALARFQPRRPSFIVIDSGSAAEWAPVLAALHQRSGGWAHPLRLLWLLSEGAPLAADSLPID